MTTLPAPAAAQSLVVVPADATARALASELAQSFPDGTVRLDLEGVEPRALRITVPAASILHIDLVHGTLTALRQGSAELRQRRFDPALAESSPFALMVIASELLALPLLERGTADAPSEEPSEEPERRVDPPGPAALDEPENVTATSRVADAEPDDTTAATSVIPVRQPEPAQTDDRALDEVDTPGEPLRWTFLAFLGYVGSIGSELVFHRPSLEIGITLGVPALRVALTAGGDLFGEARLSFDALSANRLDVMRNDVRGSLGLITSILDPVELALSFTAGVELADATSRAPDGGPVVRDAHVSPTLGAALGIRVRLVEGLRLTAAVGFSADLEARRYLADGAFIGGNGPIYLHVHAGVGWETP